MKLGSELYLCKNVNLLHQSVGSFGIVWYVFWILVSYESPAEHPTITDEERLYIEESIGESAKLLGATEVSTLFHKKHPLPTAEGGDCEDFCNYIL